MHEPAFWHRPSSLTSQLLSPLAAVYGVIAARRMSRTGMRAGLPVICVGNYHVGGAGKTPTVLALVHLLRELGEQPCVLSRGYGGSARGPLRVDRVRHVAADVGDEPLMMAAHVPVVIARDRIAGAALIREKGASIIVMDDGFQNPALHKDMSLIVVDARRGLGNGKVFPAGPLRAPLPPQLARTDALLVIGEGVAAEPNNLEHDVIRKPLHTFRHHALAAALAARGAPVWRARLTPDPDTVAALRGRRVLAFAGIGDPGRFFGTLRTNGIEVVAERRFADHHRFTPADIDALRDEASRAGLTLVTTEKDLVRLRDGELAAHAQAIVPFPVTLRFDDEPALRDFLIERLRGAQGAASA